MKEHIILQIKLPVGVEELAAVLNALSELNTGKPIFMREVSGHLQLFFPTPEGGAR